MTNVAPALRLALPDGAVWERGRLESYASYPAAFKDSEGATLLSCQGLALTGNLALKAFVCGLYLASWKSLLECELASLHLDVQRVEFHWLVLNAILCVGREVQDNGMPRDSGA